MTKVPFRRAEKLPRLPGGAGSGSKRVRRIRNVITLPPQALPSSAGSATSQPEILSNPASKSFPIVGIGASAGGLEAFTALLKGLPADTGMGFVLVQHLAPTQSGMLAELLAKAANMPVREVTQGAVVLPNHIYVIPPNTSMAIAGGTLSLLPRQTTQGQLRSIDFFLQSLAEDRKHEAIGVILSGTASDGTMGLEAIKAEGGITFAQDETAKFDSMPRSAIAAGCVDFVLSPPVIAKELARLAQHPYVARPANVDDGDEGPLEHTNEFQGILAMLRRTTGTDFSAYKLATLQRRLRRRMALGQFKELSSYLAHLRTDAAEVAALGGDFHIGVTNFFRDPGAFAFLQRKIFPRLVKAHKARPTSDTLRVWVLGCSTGQETYSIAISWLEYVGGAPTNLALQIFSTDVHPPYLDRARTGIYSRSQLQDVSPDRLRRFFVEVEGGYRVSKPIRDMCVFARQNVLTDPPFSQLNLICCRNMLIYVRAELQKKVIPILHFALKPDGVLFLGPAETVTGFPQLFAPLDPKLKFFARQPARVMTGLQFIRGAVPLRLPAREPVHQFTSGVAPVAGLEAQREADRLMLSRLAPAGVIINTALEVIQFRGSTGIYLEASPGKASLNVLKMAREGLLSPLRAATKKASKGHRAVKESGTVMMQNGRALAVTLEVIPLKHPVNEQRCFLINFEPVKDATPAPRTISNQDVLAEGTMNAEAKLRRELVETKEHLQSVIEQQDAFNEELQSGNEEAQASNEELQSVNEEMETAKEELQSSNEEITTVNEELHTRNDQLAATNSDLTNLMASVNLSIVILGRDLRIRRFTAVSEKTLNLVPTDVGRPIADLSLNILMPDLVESLARVVDTVTAYEQEVQDRQGKWFALRMRPYLSVENKVDGAVMMLVDVDELKRTQVQITTALDYARQIVETVGDALLVLDRELIVQSANRAFYELFRVSPEETEKRPILTLGNGQWNTPQLRRLLEEVLPNNRAVQAFEMETDFPRVGKRILRMNARLFPQPDSGREKILIAIGDVTEARRTETAVRISENRYRRLFEAAHDGVLILDPLTRQILDANPFMVALLGYTREELLGKELFEIGLLRDAAASRAAFREIREKGDIRYENLPLESKSGGRREVEVVANLYRENEHEAIQCNIRDITERRRMEHALRMSEERFRTLITATSDAVFQMSPDWSEMRQLDGRNITVDTTVPNRTWLATYIHPDDQSAALLTISHAVKTKGIFELEHRVRRSDGTIGWTFSRAVPRLDTNGAIVEWFGAAVDVTERKRAEDALSSSEARYRMLFDSIDEGFCIIEKIDPVGGARIDFRYIEVNPASEAQSGVKDIIGKTMRELIPGESEEWYTTFDAVLSSGTPIRFERGLPTQNRVLELYAFRVEDRPYRQVGIIFKDVTARKLNEETLLEKERRLERAVENRTSELKNIIGELETFSYTMAHELRGPLRVMQGYANILKSDYSASLDGPGQQFVGKIAAAAQRMHSLVTDVLAFTKLTGETLTLEPVLVEPLIAGVIEQYPALNLVQVSVSPNLPAALANPAALYQAVSNLLVNAIKFIPPGRSPKIDIRAESDATSITLFVRDDGIGIAPADQERIFAMLERGVGVEKYEGTGIGLSIARRAVERMGGTIGVTSKLGEGSTFWIKLLRAHNVEVSGSL